MGRRVNVLLATIAALAAVYVQLRIPRFTAARQSIIAARLILATVGAAFGYVAAITAASEALSPVLAFVMGFGAVHIPAALILLIKAVRGSGKS